MPKRGTDGRHGFESRQPKHRAIPQKIIKVNAIYIKKTVLGKAFDFNALHKIRSFVNCFGFRYEPNATAHSICNQSLMRQCSKDRFPFPVPWL